MYAIGAMFAQAPRFLFIIAAVALVVPNPAGAQSNSIAVVNSLRTQECARHLSRDKVLKQNPRLNAAANNVNGGFGMKEALQRAGYRADQSAVVHLSGVNDDAGLKSVLYKNYCKTLVDAGLSEVGVARRGTEIAIMFAAPFAPPSTDDASKVAQEVLRLVNDARSQSRRCGRKSFAAVAPLTLNEKLRVAAIGHAKFMAMTGDVTHDGADGSSPADRATHAGYVWKSVGENVAGGQLSAKEVVDGWIASPHHCENIMDPDYTEMAVAFIVNPRQKIGIFWAQEFGRPR